jgi:hypothetical protein
LKMLARRTKQMKFEFPCSSRKEGIFSNPENYVFWKYIAARNNCR